ncbi:MAG: NAD(P)/FAD-dependent oxidoreductase [Chloroflexia bacterium]
MLDRNNSHTFQALLYQVAAAELEPAGIAYPVRSILRRLKDMHWMKAEVQEVDFSAHTVRARDYRIVYDFLALGIQPHYDDIPGARELAFPLKTLEDAVDIRNHILRCFERAAREPSAPERERWLTFAIVGGGATGVEFAGALAELIRGSFARDFPARILPSEIVLRHARATAPHDLGPLGNSSSRTRPIRRG